jgi:hypothetical protein
MQNAKYSSFVLAATIYVALALYLFQPYFQNFNRLQYLLPVNACLAALGCYVLSRRWVSAFAASFFAGAIYGFGPFVLGLTKFHPTASLLAASIPWLFCPAALGTKGRWRWASWPLSALPFLAILLFFRVSAHYRLFAVPVRARLHFADLPGLIVPLAMAERGTTLLSFYHVPISALLMGLAMLLVARRFGVVVILCLGAALASCHLFVNVSPIVWLSIPVLGCSVLIGAGMQALASAGFTDRKWLLIASAVMAILAIVALLLATKYFQVFAGLASGYARLLTQSALMYILGSIAVAIIFFMARAKVRLSWVRWVVLCSATGLDIFLGARFVIDRVL